MKKLIFFSFLVCFIFFGCKSAKLEGGKAEYSHYVGDIKLDPKLDDPNFSLCNGEGNSYQYFHFHDGPVYIGEKISILNTFHTHYKPIQSGNNDGYVRIRFVVNCEGKADRFRVLQSDLNYNECKLNPKIANQLLDITKNIKDWALLSENDEPLDYYMYLLFKIENGEITEILP